MVVQDKNTREVCICVELRKLNDACEHDLFLTPFTDEFLEGVGVQEMYSFIDGFSGYHQIRIVKEDCYKTAFFTEWGCFQYHCHAIWAEECTSCILSRSCRCI